MKWIIPFLIFAVTAFSENFYEKHLPKDLYECLMQQELFDQNCPENSIEKQYGASTDTITVTIQIGKGLHYVSIDYWCGQAMENFRGMQAWYRNGQLAGCAIFDKAGRDYVASPPFSKKEAKEIKLDLLALIHGGYAKLTEAP